MTNRRLSDGVLEHISESIPSAMSILASLVFILVMTAPSVQTVVIDVDGISIVNIDTDEQWVTIEVIDYSGNMTLELVRNNGQHLTPHVIDGEYCRDMLIRFKDKNTSAYLVLNGTGWVHLVIYGYSQQVNIVLG